jgi:hypothetical protein
MVALGSTTLFEIRQNVWTGGDAIPVELEDSEDEESEDEDENGGYKAKPVKRKEWGEERRVTGSVFGIEGILYPDIGEGKLDYAQCVPVFIVAACIADAYEPFGQIGYGIDRPNRLGSCAKE